MSGANDKDQKADWIRLCERATTEQDPDRLVGLVKEICRLLEEKEQLLRGNQPEAKK